LVFHYHPNKAVKIDFGIDYVSFSRYNKGPKDDILRKKQRKKKKKKKKKRKRKKKINKFTNFGFWYQR
jgi:hypothetical protein